MLRSYLQLAATHRRFVSFGFFAAFASSFGQTYFIGIFGPEVQREFGLSHTAWGSVYMVGTLASALLLPWTGKQIDRFDLGHYTLAVGAAAAGACLLMSAAGGVATLAIAIFALRQLGQGLTSHLAVTSMARYFEVERGRAIAIASLGFAAGEAVLPLIAVLAIAALGWRETYFAVAIAIALVWLPATRWLLAGHAQRHRAHLDHLDALERASPRDASGRRTSSSWTRAEVLRDPRFYLLLPGLLAPSMIITGLFFHHLNLADAKGWSHVWITGNYVLYAAASVFASLLSGPLIDRLGAVRLVPWMLVPQVLSLLVIGAVEPGWVVWPYLALMGLSVGLAHTAVSAMWAELYGIAHLGAVKSLASSLSVFASALGPVSMGALMDRGTSIETICLLFAGYCTLGAILIAVALSARMHRPHPRR